MWPALQRFDGTYALAITAFLLGVIVMLMYRPFSQLEGADDAIWDYISQSIVRGQVPYRDVIDNKAPGAAYLSALVMAAGKLAGLQDVIAVRLAYVLLAGLLCALTYLLAETYLESRLAAIIAFLVPLMSTDLAIMLISGTRPKLPMILFGLATLLLVSRNKPFWAGFCSMLSCICWQPGLLFTGTAVLIFSKYLTSWRDRRALNVMLGAVVPLAVLLTYFYSAGALDELWTCTIDYNYRVYLPEGNLGPSVALARLWYLINEVMGPNVFWVKLSAVGISAFAIERVWIKLKGINALSESGLFKDAILLPPLVYLVFRTINYPGEDDLIPLFPFIGIFAGFFFAELVNLLRLFQRKVFHTRFAELLLVIPILLLLFFVLDGAAKYRVEPGRTLPDQQLAFRAISDVLAPDDKIYVHGTLEILVLLNRPNLNRYIFLARGTDDYVASTLPGGFSGLIEQMEAEAPKVISLSRLRNVAHRDELIEWATKRYDKLPLAFAHNSVFVRKQE
ncbi:MAG: DolP-mannose mannosyltransferase [Blastocatellia bacterium]